MSYVVKIIYHILLNLTFILMLNLLIFSYLSCRENSKQKNLKKILLYCK